MEKAQTASWTEHTCTHPKGNVRYKPLTIVDENIHGSVLGFICITGAVSVEVAAVEKRNEKQY